MSTTSSGSSTGGPGSRIHDYRIARNMTQKALAGDGYSVSYISAIERGKVNPSERALQWCAERLGVSVFELRGEPVLKSSSGRWIQEQLGRNAYEQVYAQLLITVGELEEGQRRVRQLRREASAPIERALIWFSAYGSLLADDLDEAAQEAEAYRRLVEETRDARGLVALHWLLGSIAMATADVGQAHLEFARALEAEPDSLSDPDAAQAIQRALAAALRARHDPTRAHQVEVDALRDYERFADPRERLKWAQARAEKATAAGDYPQAYLLIRWAWNSQREAATHRHAAELYLRHATYIGEDLPGEQREAALRRAALLAELAGDNEVRTLAGAYLAQLLVERGALAVAEEVLRLTAPGSSAAPGTAIDGEQDIVLALAHGWMAAARGQDDIARGLGGDVVTALNAMPNFNHTSAEFAGVSLSRLFDRLGDEERAFAALKRANSIS